MPFIYSPYHAPYTGSISELMMVPGQAQARAAEQSGQAWSQAAQGIGQGIAGAVQQVTDPRLQLERQQVDANKRTLAFNDTVNKISTALFSQQPDGSSPIDLAKAKQMFAAANVPVSMQSAVLKELEGVNDSITKFNTTRIDHVADVAHGALQSIKAGADPQTALAFGLAAAKANHLVSDEQVQPLIDAIGQGADIAALLTQVRGFSEKYKDLSKPVVLPRPGASVYTPATGVTETPVPAPAEKPTEATLAFGAASGDATAARALELMKKPAPKGRQAEWGLLDGKQVAISFDPETGKRYDADGTDITARVKPIPAASITIHNEKKAEGKENREELADLVRNGLMTPQQLSKRAEDYNDILATASRRNKEETGKPLNVAKLQLDYEAAKKWVVSMNGPQMTRFKGLAVSVVNTIDEVKKLGDELKQGGIQKWNSVTRKTVQQLYGNTPQSDLANRYMVAVNTLKEEFANLANGGYAPTEDAWKLANSQINENYGFKDLTSALSEVQRLINYRVNAFNDVQPTKFGEPPQQMGAPEMTDRRTRAQDVLAKAGKVSDAAAIDLFLKNNPTFK